ncbi:GNAT family N-acetyltransferase [Streptomyces oceani]|uniref:GNAT family acetyltransferase n=1 Tax=Streptomyces oceani TaxID=1075402 RepID=A0A1E7JV85_9ACTN|nr:GNAT family N-acetyltransferase [Streptomyces oceani]OEU94382.1 GNAT family acetyltransferase [Streptomyces oceani]
MDNSLRTARLRLRPVRESDAEQLAALHGDPEVMRYLGPVRPISPATVRAETVPRMCRYHPGLGGPGYWAAESRDDGSFLGWFEYRPLAEDSGAVVELGYRLRQAAWGLGYATEGARALVRTGFEEWGVRRVTANTMVVNTPSRRVLEKTGLTLRCTYFQDWPEAIEGAEHGEVEYALDRADWPRAGPDTAGPP